MLGWITQTSAGGLIDGTMHPRNASSENAAVVPTSSQLQVVPYYQQPRYPYVTSGNVCRGQPDQNITSPMNMMAGVMHERVHSTAMMPDPNLRNYYYGSGVVPSDDGGINAPYDTMYTRPPSNYHPGYEQNYSCPQHISEMQQQPPLARIPPSELRSPSYVAYPDYHTVSANSNRVMRNLAEKMRRDKLNTYISELASLVPMVSTSPKRMDKTSVLRLSATFLRMNRLITGTMEQRQKLPQFLNSVNWSQLLLDDIDGVMLIVTSAGKIVFISHNVEKVLGHTQVELFGQSLFNITCPEDHPELKRYLSPDEQESETRDSGNFTYERNSGGYSGNAAGSNVTNASQSYTLQPYSSPDSTNNNNNNSNNNDSNDSSADTVERQKRSFYLRLRHRCVARSEQPQYELVHVLGHLRIPKKCNTSQRRSRKHKDTVITGSNEVVLVAVLKPFRERRVTEVSLIEASRDEYITRHLLDGRIIYCDHRISVVSGYLSEEVSGLSAFNFMHKDDVRWVLIALRQMYWRGESYGSSCYRLKSKTGEFIYLRTHGYLEFNANTEQYASFICVNSLVSSEEGEQEIRNMKNRFSPLIENKVEPGIAAIAERHISVSYEDHHIDEEETEDPAELKTAIKAMIANIPPANLSGCKEDPEKSQETQFVKAKLMSKALPPTSQHAANIIIEEKISKTPSPSSRSQTSGSPLSRSQPATPSPPPPPSARIQNRPSVLRIAPSVASKLPITIYSKPNSINSPQSNVITTTCRMSGSTGVNSNFSPTPVVNVIDMRHIERGTLVRHNSVPDTTCNGGRLSDIVSSRSAVKRRLSEDIKPATAVPPKRASLDITPTTVTYVPPSELERQIEQVQDSQFQFYHHIEQSTILQYVPQQPQQPPNNPFLSEIQQLGIPYISTYETIPKDELSAVLKSETDTNEQDFPHLRMMRQPRLNLDIGNEDQFEEKPDVGQVLNPVDNTSEDVRSNHVKLESDMHYQGAQITAIQEDLSTVPFENDQNYFRVDLSQLKEEHTKQKKLLRNLRSDHSNLNQCATDEYADVPDSQEDIPEA